MLRYSKARQDLSRRWQNCAPRVQTGFALPLSTSLRSKRLSPVVCFFLIFLQFAAYFHRYQVWCQTARQPAASRLAPESGICPGDRTPHARMRKQVRTRGGAQELTHARVQPRACGHTHAHPGTRAPTSVLSLRCFRTERQSDFKAGCITTSPGAVRK